MAVTTRCFAQRIEGSFNIEQNVDDPVATALGSDTVRLCLLSRSIAPILWLAAMMLNGDDNDSVDACFVDDAVGKPMYQATSSALR